MQQRENLSEEWPFFKRKRSVGILCAYLCASAPCFLLAACGGSADPQQITQSLESWSRSVEFAQQQWHEHRVSDAYLAQLLKAAAKEKAKQEQEIQKLNRVGANVTNAGGLARELELKIAEAKAQLSRAKPSAP